MTASGSPGSPGGSGRSGRTGTVPPAAQDAGPCPTGPVPDPGTGPVRPLSGVLPGPVPDSGAEQSPLTVLVIAKEPVAGRVKTRLTPPYTPQEAALLAQAALEDTLETVARLPVRRRVLVLAGRPGRWLPRDAGFEVVPQAGGGLDERIAAAFALCEGPALLVGMDTPQMTPQSLAPALAPEGWRGRDAWFGPAADGGFWALGMARPRPELVRGVPMSTQETGTVQRRRLLDAGLVVGELPVLRDVDTAQDAAQIAGLAPGSFAEMHARLARAVAR